MIRETAVTCITRLVQIAYESDREQVDESQMNLDEYMQDILQIVKKEFIRKSTQRILIIIEKVSYS